RLAAGGAEGGEILFANEVPGGAVHGRGVEGFLAPAEQAAKQRRAHRLVADEIAIGAGGGREARVEAGGHLTHPVEAHRIRQPGIGAEQPVAGFAAGGGVEMDDLVGGGDAGVGAPGAHQGDRRGGDTGQGRLHGALDTGAVGLTLPPTKEAAVVFDGGGEAANTRGKLGSLGHQTVGEIVPVAGFRHPAQCSWASSAWAFAFCWSLPDSITCWRISRAPALSPMSRYAWASSSWVSPSSVSPKAK